MYKKYIVYAILFLVILAAVCIAYQAQSIRRAYKSEALKGLKRTAGSEMELLTENDIKDLPEPVQKYIRYTGSVGKEKVLNYKMVSEGVLKTDPKKDWSRIQTEQYSFADNPGRLYYLRGNFSGLPAYGLDSYINGKGGMLIKLGGLIKVVDAESVEMNQAALVTLFNDMCMLAPATLIDKRIQWETLDPLVVKGTFEDNGIKVSALLYFNNEGQLIEFVTDDRYYSPTGKTYQKVRWSTPVKDYKDFNGVRLSSYGEAIWHFPEGDYCYGKLNLIDIKYNCKSFE